MEESLLDKFDPKILNCLFKMKLGAKTNSNILISIIILIWP